jgi:hypothetical protein
MPLQSRVHRIVRGVLRAALLAGAVALVVAGASASAQNIGQTTGQIEGVVVDASGLVLPGVTITITSPALTGSKVVVSGGSGEYVVPGLPTGVYRLEAMLDGFISVAVENIVIKPGVAIKPNIRMSPGLKTEVTVVASPVLDVLSSGASNNLSAEVINELPKGRSWDSVVQLAPAVNNETIQGEKGISFRGASISENAYIVDGVDTTSVVVGTTGQDIMLDFVDEVQVKSGFVGADYGGALGGIVNVVTKSGSNDLKVLLNFQYSGSGLTGAPRPTLRVVPTNNKAAEYITYAEDPMDQLDFGGTVGGSIKRDRVWFFGGWMPQYVNTDREATFSDKTTGSYTSEVRRNFFTGKVTAKATQNLNVNFNVNVSPYNTQGALPNLDGTSSSTVDYEARGTRSNKIAYAVGMDWVASSKFFVNAFAGYHTKKSHDEGVPVLPRYRYQTSNIGQAGVPVEFQHPILWETSSPTENVFANDDTRFSFGATASLAFNAAGRHMLKTGFQYSRPTTYLNYGYTNPDRLDLQWGSSFAGQRGTYGIYRLFDVSQDGQVISDNEAIFVQDTWSVSRFTLNLGLRTERENLTPFVDTSAVENIYFGFGDKLAPRFGVAWDVRGDSSWKVYANAGMFYDMLKHSAPRDGFGGGVFTIDYYTLDTYDYNTLHKANPQGRQLYRLDLRGSGDTLDPDIKPARTNVFAAGTEIALSKDLTLGVGYVHRTVSHINEDTYVLQANGTYLKVFGNPGEGMTTQPYGSAYPAQPVFERNYDGVDFQLRKRMSNNWTGTINYTFSRLEGNYDGLADPDQQMYADVNPNLGIYCDYLEGCYAANGQKDWGRLSADRPHQFKMNGAYSFPWGLTVGAYFQALSGLPITGNLGVNSATVTHPDGRGGNGRNKMFSQTDLSLSYGIKMGQTSRATILLNVINLFDQDSSTRTYQNMLMSGGTSIRVPIATYFSGYNYNAVIDSQGAVRDPRYLMVDRYQAPISARIGVKFEF